MISTALTSLELFSGGGGLALGLERSKFDHLALVEINKNAAATLRVNGTGADRVTRAEWPVYDTDASLFDYARFSGQADLLAAGAPCQPFSLGGKHRGQNDKRNLFPIVFKAVRTIRPKAVLIENVRGILRPNFKKYLDYIIAQLAFVDAEIMSGETWEDHKDRLSKLDASMVTPAYKVFAPWSINCADFGVPQQRHRVFILAFRNDVPVSWLWPEKTHSREALSYVKWVDGSYWTSRGLPRPNTPTRVRIPSAKPAALPWVTVRDALRGLPVPVDGVQHSTIKNHFGIPGARLYAGHSGSPLDEPAKAIKAGDHGVPGGENMLVDDLGKPRYFSPREAARIQTFPDSYVFAGSRTESMRQIGNAVPVRIAEILGAKIHQALSGQPAKSNAGQQLMLIQT